MESLENSQEQKESEAVLKFQEIKTASQQTDEKSNQRIEEIPSEKSKTKSQKTS